MELTEELVLFYKSWNCNFIKDWSPLCVWVNGWMKSEYEWMNSEYEWMNSENEWMNAWIHYYQIYLSFPVHINLFFCLVKCGNLIKIWNLKQILNAISKSAYELL